jgi:hypothetical protein
LIPTIAPNEIRNYGERMFAERLVKQVHSRVMVFHSINWLAENREGVMGEGESDFVILDPEWGLLFVEVKAGTIRCEPGTYEWVRVKESGQKEKIKSPFGQVRRSMHVLIDKIKAHPVFRSGIPFVYAYAAAFQGSRRSGALPTDIVPELIFDADRCERMQGSQKEAFQQFAHPGHERMNAVQIKAICEVLYPSFGVTPVLWRQLQDQEVRLNRLTEEQAGTRDFLSHHKKARIRGVAVSDKTILALAKAQEIARQGAKTLFLCYNAQLKEWLDRAAEKEGENLVFANYHEVVFVFCRKAGLDHARRNDESRDAYWNDRLPALMDSTSILGPEHKFDALIVDEGAGFSRTVVGEH